MSPMPAPRRIARQPLSSDAISREKKLRARILRLLTAAAAAIVRRESSVLEPDFMHRA